MFFRPVNSEPTRQPQADAVKHADVLKQAARGSAATVPVAVIDPATESTEKMTLETSDPFFYTPTDLEALQNGEAIQRGVDPLAARLNGPAAPADDDPSGVHGGLEQLTATEVAAFAIADQLEAGTVVDSTFGAESFVLREPKQKMSNAEAHWMTEEEKWGFGYAWPIVIWMTVLHVGAVIALPFFSWEALVVSLVLHWVSGSLGVCLGFHRLLTHGGFKTYPWVKALLTFAGQTAGEGSADMWVATHRKHHALSDKPGDPHSPHDGSWWSHMLWIYPFKTDEERQELLTHWAPDMAKDPVVSWVSKHFLATHFVVGFALLGLGYAYGGWSMALSMMMWGVFVRTVAVLHVTWFVNSASHMFGYRNYETTDDSRNNWWVAILAYGEGWHNNHHAYPRMAVHGHKWWEFDATWQFLRLMRVCGLAWDIVDYRTNKEKRDRDAAKGLPAKH
jgi:stearoyl-CoA desaturase (delta-9 desaturase)